MKLTLLHNPARSLKPADIKFILNRAKHHGYSEVDIVVSEPGRSLKKIVGKPNLIIAVGGDGTVLAACHLSRGSGCPVIGINTGHVGFLTAIGAQELHAELDNLLAGKVRTETRLGIRVEVADNETAGWGMNDVILRGKNGIFEADVLVNGAFLTTYRADGLVISTPTGSTAYNLSIGGSILAPTLEVLAIMPIAPMSLLNRCIVLSATEVITVIAKRDILVETDSIPVAEAKAGDHLRIHRSATGIPLRFLPDRNHYDALGKRLGWNLNTIPEKATP